MFQKLFRRLYVPVAPDRAFAGPDGQRVYAVGDIHGRLDLLDALLAQIAGDIAEHPLETVGLVFLGDLIDRGPDSAGVLERLRTLSSFPATPLFLLGNHEEILLRVLAAEPALAYDWLGFGGDACAESYGVPASALAAMSEAQIADALTAAIPPSHIAFLKAFGDTFRFGDYLFVHAGIRPGIPLEAQQPQDLRWIRSPFLTDANDHGFLVVHGHTITDGVERRANRIGIDTGAYRTDVLTAIVVEQSEIRFLQTGQ